jgi:bifunctional DNA-binding transcriptional regulator/antitoxin component of YhaV-PrlF toxin-antitoxin module
MDSTNSRNLKKYWIETIQQDGNGELVLPFPQELLDEVGWKPGDDLEWHDRGDGTWEIRKKLEQSDNEDS